MELLYIPLYMVGAIVANIIPRINYDKEQHKIIFKDIESLSDADALLTFIVEIFSWFSVLIMLLYFIIKLIDKVLYKVINKINKLYKL